MTLLDISLFFLASAVGGAINAVAGGGTFLVFPVLMMSGMGAVQANIMSTIALWPGSVSSVFAYRRQISIEKKRLASFMLVSAVGSILGTAILLLSPERTFERLVPWLLLGATLLFTFGRAPAPQMSDVTGQRAKSLLPSAFCHLTSGTGGALLLQFLIAIYGGYFGAGIGILMLAMLQLIGMHDIHKMNALKAMLGSTINAVAVFIFLFSGHVIWPLAAVMIVGAIAGGYLGASMARKVSPTKIRLLVSTIGFAMTAYFFTHGV